MQLATLQPETEGGLESAIRQRSAVAAVIGLGYVGLPVVRRLVEAGFRTLGYDVDEEKIARLREGASYVGHIESDWIAAAVAEGRFRPLGNAQVLAEADVVLVCVPTPLSPSRDPDLSFVEATAGQLAATLRPGQLIVLESTTYPGTTRGVVLPILAATGLTVGKDFFLAYSPEREDPGRRDRPFRSIPKVVGGIDSSSTHLARLFYRHLVDKVITVSSCETAEATKILENTYRAVNIALVNELKMLLDRLEIDVWEVIEAAATKPFGFQAFYPGPGLGGHCIPVDPFYLSWLARTQGTTTRFTELAGEINRAVPDYVMRRLAEALNQQGKPLRGSRVCLLGVAYKPDVDDPRESPALVLLEQLGNASAVVSYNDPLIPRLPSMRNRRLPELASTPLDWEFLARQDAVVIVTDHSTYDYAFILQHARLVIDTRNATRHVKDHRHKIVKA